MSQTNSTGTPLNPSDQNYNNLNVTSILTAKNIAARKIIANELFANNAIVGNLEFPTIAPAVIFDNVFARSGAVNQAVVYGPVTTVSVQFVALQNIPQTLPATVVGHLSGFQIRPLVDATAVSFAPNPPELDIAGIASSNGNISVFPSNGFVPVGMTVSLSFTYQVQ